MSLPGLKAKLLVLLCIPSLLASGESGLVVPGLNVPVTADLELTNQLYIPEKKDHSFKERMAKARAEDLKKRRVSIYKVHHEKFEPPDEKTNNLHMRKQRRRSASRLSTPLFLPHG